MFYFFTGNDLKRKNRAVVALAKKLGLEKEAFTDERVLLEDVLISGDLLSAAESKLLVFPACDDWKHAKENWDFLVKNQDYGETHAVCFLAQKKPKIIGKLKKDVYAAREGTLPEKSWELGKWLDKECEARELHLKANSKQMLLQRNSSAEGISTDLEKIIVLGASFKEKDLAQLLPPTPESDYFAFLDSFVGGKQQQALGALRGLLSDGEEPIGILVRLTKQLCSLRALQEQVRPEKMHPYALKKAEAQARLLPTDENYWAQALASALELDVKLRAGMSVHPQQDLLGFVSTTMQSAQRYSDGSTI